MAGIPGDPAAIEAAADDLVAAGEQFQDVRDSLVGHVRGGLARWSGAASEMASARLEEYADKIQIGADACPDAAPPLRTFAAALRTAQQQYADAEAKLAAGQAWVDGARPGVAGEGARAYGQEMVATAEAAMGAAWERVRQAAEVAGSQIDDVVDRLDKMEAEAPGDVVAPAPPAPPDDEDSGGINGHLLLDGAGLLGPIGPFADGANSIWYALEGDWKNALFSVGTAVPVFGDAFAAVKLGGKGLGAARGADEAADAARAISKPSSRQLGTNLEAAGAPRPPGTAAHHIVAGNSRGAQDARETLDELDIDINEAGNGVFLPANRGSPNPDSAATHSTLHTDAYYNEVNRILGGAETREEALEALEYIRTKLQSGWSPR